MDNSEYGIARLSIIPVRKDPDNRSELVTQLLFGDPYTVIEYSPSKKWMRIRILFDSYEGWIHSSQHNPITPEYFAEITKNDYRISTEITSTVLFKKKPLTIVIGSILPLSANEMFDASEQFAFNGESKSLGQKRDYEFLIQIACKYLNVPYLWGGKSPFGIDCSGFTQMVFKITGYPLKRDVSQQIGQGSEIRDFTKIKSGDLAFFSDESGKLSHVGVVMDKNRIIHSSGYVRIDNFNEKGIFNEKMDLYTHKFDSVRRVLK